MVNSREITARTCVDYRCKLLSIQLYENSLLCDLGVESMFESMQQVVSEFIVELGQGRRVYDEKVVKACLSGMLNIGKVTRSVSHCAACCCARVELIFINKSLDLKAANCCRHDF